jgi:hypothetical protein
MWAMSRCSTYREVRVNQLTEFFNDPLVLGIYSLFVVSICCFLLAVYRSLGDGTFDVQKLPQILRTLVLDKMVPLIILGVATFAVTEPTAKTGLLAAYGGMWLLALGGEVKNLIALAQNSTPPPPTVPPKTK